jgi:hypothetical protein
MRVPVVILAGMATWPALLGSLRAQTTFGSISGTVTDPAGALVPRASVTATHEATGYRYEATSNEAGYYTIA